LQFAFCTIVSQGIRKREIKQRMEQPANGILFSETIYSGILLFHIFSDMATYLRGSMANHKDLVEIAH
jgi:hypothetical protein